MLLARFTTGIDFSDHFLSLVFVRGDQSLQRTFSFVVIQRRWRCK